MKLHQMLIFIIIMLIGSTVQASTAPPITARSDQDAFEHSNPTTDYNTPTAQSKFVKNKNSKSTYSISSIDECNVDAFATSNTTTLINVIKAQGASCVNELFSASSSIQIDAFSSDNMYAIANHTKNLADAYTGNGDPDLEALYLFIRAGYYAEYYNESITFSSWVKPAVKGAIDAFVYNGYFYDNNDNHGRVLQEVITSMDSSEQQDIYLPVVKEWLSRWNESYAANRNMQNAVNGIFTILYRGQWNEDFIVTIENDTTLVSNLRSFALSSWMIDSGSEFMISNAGRELGRLKKYSDTAIQPDVDSALNAIFSAYQMYGYGDAVWLGTADTANYYGDCADYGICGYEDQIMALALSQTYTCSDTINIRSQNLTTLQQLSACAAMQVEESYFHSKLQTGNTPVEDDLNTQLQVNVFDKDTDYAKYAAAIFGINTNNGGMYLEGDPSAPGNVPNFVCYEAQKANADHYIWNLEHEYVHYLDGRFDLYGDFNAPTEEVVWWAEGIAEYISNQDCNQAAYDTIHDGSTYDLDIIFRTNYDGFDQDRIYRWGYIAVRFMMERHMSEVLSMIDLTREGNWTAYKSLTNTWESNYSSEFTAWTQTMQSTGCDTDPPTNIAPVAVINGPFISSPDTSTSMSGSDSEDADGTISSYDWDFGDGTTGTGMNTSHTYASNGSYSVKLTVTDNKGAIGTTTTSATITSGNELINNKPESINGSQGTEQFFTMTTPANAGELIFTIGGGSGDADIYIKFGSAPTQSDYDHRPYLEGNNETVTISDAQQGVYHIMIYAYNNFDTTLTGSYGETPDAGVPDICATQSPLTDGPLEDGVAVCLGNEDPMWFHIPNVDAYSSVAISTGNGTGNLDIEYSNSGWPNDSNVDAYSMNPGNSECIHVTNQSQYWGYIKVSGASEGASIIIDFNTDTCR